MCGFAGLITSGSVSAEALSAVASRMGERIAHRGPDSSGVWTAMDEPVALAHRRLAILDLSPMGAQPMVSRGGRFVIAYNGELFNFPELLRAVEARQGSIAWRGHSDTEVLLEAIETFGVDAALPRCNGMFAFALWDRRERTLCLARDPLGKKPLYYSLLGEHLVFASEIKALAAHPGWSFSADRGALQAFLRHGYVPAPASGIQGVSKLEPGCALWVRPSDVRNRKLGTSRRYWDPSRLRSLAATQPTLGGDLESVLATAVNDRLVADVPVGAFLSGGVDSSLMVALMARQGGPSIHTFAVGFADGAYSEAPHAAAVARHLGTQHTELLLDSREISELVPTVIATYDEPLADPSAIPTWLVSRLAASKVKVVISGDGADELFGGYTRYRQNERLWQLRSVFPGVLARPVRSMLTRILDAPGAGTVAALLSAVAATNATEFYRCRVSHVRDPSRLIRGASESRAALMDSMPALDGIVREMMYMDLVTYLTDDILAKVDRASMAHGLEVRSPFLDDRVVRYAWSLPDSAVIGPNSGKRMLKDLLFTLVPRGLVDRPKAGFGPPVEAWLAGPLRSWAEAQLFGGSRLVDAGVDIRQLQLLWQKFIAGRRRLGGLIWNLVVLGAWLDSQRRMAMSP